MEARGFTVRPLRSSAPLSKSRFVHGMQCPLYVWLEVRTDAPRAEIDAFTQALFDAGNEVGEQARLRWDQRQLALGRSPGLLVTDDPRMHADAVAETRKALADGVDIIHEAAFTHGGVKVRVDVLERLGDGTFAIHEVKSTAHYDKVKHLNDAAVQLWTVRGAGLNVTSVDIVHLNGDYEWPGGDYDLEQLFVQTDVTEAAEAIQESIGLDVSRLLRILAADRVPAVPDGVSCKKPYDCPFGEVCPALGDPVEHPVGELPGTSVKVEARAREAGFVSLLEIDEVAAARIIVKADGTPSERWLNTWKATVRDERIVLDDCRAWIGDLVAPVRHLDFETIGAPLPVVLHTRPFQVVPLQYSLHTEERDGSLSHREFMVEANDPDPRRSLIEQLLDDLGESGSIIHWASHEHTVIKKISQDPRYAEFRAPLEAVLVRLCDLGKAVDNGVFDRGFHGKWSLKKVYPVLVPGADADGISEGNGVISYDDLDGVAKGDEAAMLLLEYMRPEIEPERRTEIRRQLLQYCELDTRATVEVLRQLRRECALA